jgi:hypothetical protein
MNHSSFYYLYMYVKKNASWCHCPPTCIDIIYILHVYLSLCVVTIYCTCVSTNKY